MVKGAVGVLHTPGAPAPTDAPAPPTVGSTAPVELVCLARGHHMAGQHQTITVSG